MANTKKFAVKNGLLTQNVDFISPNETKTITATMLDSDVLSFSGNSGQLFSISDSMTGTIFAVNDISGVPSIEVFDSGKVQVAELFGNVLIGTSTDNTTDKLQVNGNISGTALVSTSSAGDEGGEIRLNKAVTNTTLTTGVTIDVYQNKLRIFETGGTNRGLYFDLSTASASVGTNGLASAAGVTSVTGTAPIVSSGGVTPAISITAATTSAAGSMSAADKTKLDGIASGATANTGTVTSVATSGTVSGLTLTGGTITTTGTITLGGTLAVLPSNFASQTANTVLAAPNGADGVPTFRTLVATDIPTLNQNTTGNAATASTSGLLSAEDNRTISPSELVTNRARFGFTSWANNNTAPYADFLHLRSYTDSSGGQDNLVMFRKDVIGMRIWQQTFGSSTAYATYKDVAFTDSNITGSAATLTTARLINGVSFNGSADITIADSTKLPLTGGTLSGELTFSDDSEGVTLYGGARVYKKAGSGLILRRHTADIDPQVENNAATSSWTILHGGNYTSYVGNGTLGLSIGTAGATNTTVTVGTGTGFAANSSSNYTYDIKVGPALTNLATLMTTAGAGFIKRGATADTYTIDTNTYLTSYSETDTLATVTARGATTATAISLTNTTDATSTTAGGTLTISGGAAIAKKLYVGTDASIAGNLTIDGNFTVNGTTTTVNTQNLSVSDNMIYLNQAETATVTNVSGNGTTVTYTAANSFTAGMIVTITGVNPTAYNLTNVTIATANATTFTVTNAATGTFVSGGTALAKTAVNPDLGISGGYNDGTYAHAGIFRDATDGYWKVFKGYTPEPDASVYIDTTHASFALADIQAANFRGALVGNADTATKWATGRTISLTGDVTYTSGSLDGSGNVTGTATLANSGATAGTYNNVTVNTKGLVTSGTNVAYLTSYAETDTLATVTARGATTATAISLTNTGTSLTASGKVAIATATAPVTNLQVGAKVIDDATIVYDTNALLIAHQTATSSTVLNDPKDVLYLTRQGTAGQAYGAKTAFKLSRWENNSTNSRTRLDINLSHTNFDDVNIMSLRSDGNVGIGTNSPSVKLEVVAGNIKASNTEASLTLTATAANGRTWNVYSGGGGNVGPGAFSIAEAGATQRFVIEGGGTGESVRINASGNVGIGNTAPSVALEVGSTTTGRNVKVTAGLGAELAPALEAVNWTGTNWTAGSGTLTHTTGTIGSISPTTAITPIVGTTYKVVMTVSAGNIYTSWSLGGTAYQISAAGTYTWYTTAKTTAAFTIANATVGDPTITISALSIKAFAASTGSLTVDGPVIMNSTLAIANIGIGTGTTLPSSPLQIVDNGSGIRVSRNTNYNQFAFMDAGNGASFRFGGQGADKPVQFINQDAINYGYEFYIGAAQKVGITNAGILNVGVNSGVSQDFLRIGSATADYHAFGNYNNNELYIQPHTYYRVLRGYAYTTSNRKQTSADTSILVDNNNTFLAYDKGNVNIGYTTDQTFKLAVSGTGFASSDFRAPIFYDSNNTTYYADLANSGTSILVNGNVAIDAGDGKGFRFWNSDSYKIWMSSAGAASVGGRIAGDTTSDYNMYFRMAGGGTNRGYVFETDNANKIFAINPNGVRSNVGVTIAGALQATTKSFLIDHPTKPGKKLLHGSLEGPEHGVYVRGKVKGNVIELPEYWTKLVDPDSITVQLTAIGKGQKLYVEDIRDNKVYIGNDGVFAAEPNCFYLINAERIDIDKLIEEVD